MWSSNIGVILAVAGSAVGLGNFLRFPGQAAQFGGGAFMIAYFVSFIVLGIPMGWMEWILGRHGGKQGFCSPPGILTCAWKHPAAKYIGAIAAVTTFSLYSYYSYVEGWCLGYAINFLNDNIAFNSIEEAGAFFNHFIGIQQDGDGIHWGWDKVAIFITLVFLINFTLAYRGISKGIEKYARFAVPTLLGLSVIILIRVLTIGTPNPTEPNNSINNGLGFMWNPNKTFLYEKIGPTWKQTSEIVGLEAIKEKQRLIQQFPEKYKLKEVTFIDQLKRPKLWLAAAAQVFFSLAVGFGAIMVYASYTKPDDDLVLSSLSASSANEFAEIALGGLITLPAAFAFLGASGVIGQSIFGLGFNVLPLVFSLMPLGKLFGFLFFFLLFIASISGALCMLQSGIAFFEETLDLERKRAVTLAMILTSLGCTLVFWFSKDLKGMDTFDFWVGNFLIFTVSTVNMWIFGWRFGPKKIFEEAHKGASVKIPKFFIPIIRYLSPAFLGTIFLLWVLIDVFGLGRTGIDYHILDLIGSETHPANKAALLVFFNIVFVCFIMCLIVSRVSKYKKITSKKSSF